MAVYEFFTSRNNAANVATFVGQAGRLFYDGANGVIKLSDGTTPGGTFIPYNIATTSTIGGIKAGPGANVATDGTLTIDTTGLPLSFGDFVANVNVLGMSSSDEDMILATEGNATIKLVGNVQFVKTDGPAGSGNIFINATNQGFMTIYAPVVGANTAGALNIVGGTNGTYQPVKGAGGMLHVTGNDGTPARITFDAFGTGAFPSIVGRQARGTAYSPTATQDGDVLLRISALGWAEADYNTTSVGGPPTSIDFVATDNYTHSVYGSKIAFYTSTDGSISRTLSATIDSNGITTANISGNSLSLTGDISYNPTYGCFHKQANVTAVSSNTVYAFDWYANTHVHEGNDGVTVASGTPSRVYIDTAGDYNISIEMQIVNVDNAERVAYIWLALDGTDVSHSSLKIGLRPAGGGTPSYQSIFQTWTVSDVLANSYIELKFAVDNPSGISLEYAPGISSPYVRPATPSATFTITPV